ncbi:hypothetical protein [Actinotalea sp. K2]|uniref:hypothetical protein n=1 Tax=Actinotalea sp. K2 TaxID=2939438 RepID=UPI002017E2E9|nr:hypothetical protein [Actinotalea sp. K2]MCL3859928.1 hypothetical protein [Actinotalea sp. K2]
MNAPRSTRTRATRPVGLLLTVGVAAGLGACGPSGADVPEGFVQVGSGRLEVAVPQGWVPVEGDSELWPGGWADAELDDAQHLLIVSPEFGTGGADLGRSTFVAGAQIGGVTGYTSDGFSEPVQTDSLEIARNDFTYTGPDGERYEGIFWAAADPRSGDTVALQLTGSELPADLVDGIEGSIRLGDGADDPA